jgi:hypothetical protein
MIRLKHRNICKNNIEIKISRLHIFQFYNDFLYILVNYAFLFNICNIIHNNNNNNNNNNSV